MVKNLIIVESPAKAKTIERYLGAGYTVKSSMGHIRGLPSKPGSVDTEHGYAPKYEIDPGKKKIIAELKSAARDSQVWLASDEDREGEAIAWHLSQVLGLDPKATKRIVFHEITKPALEHAVDNPRVIDLPLVESQQARQTLDYLVGFELSPVLWRKVRPGLSAGRVQSVATRLVVDREREIEAHEPTSSFKIKINFKLKDDTTLEAKVEQSYDSAEAARKVLESWIRANFAIKEVNKRPGTRNPSPPFTTSTLQQAASNRLGFSPRQTMRLAQQLYEEGLITYMRTDSLNLSQLAVGQMNQFIINKFGANYASERHFKTSSAGAQEAHEAIRPTDVNNTNAGADDKQKKIYDLIWRRALASQMAAAKLEKTTIKISSDQGSESILAEGEVVTFDGFIKVFGKSGEDNLLPPVKIGDAVDLINAACQQTLSRGPARYTEASLIKELEKRGIGRPSTYAPTLSTIESRGYVERGSVDGTLQKLLNLELSEGKVTESWVEDYYGKDTNKLLPTDTGKVVTDFLTRYFAEVMNYDFTKEIEAELDDIAEKDKNKQQVLDDFYKPFRRLVAASTQISRAEANQARHLGDDPNSGRPIYARFGRYGPMLQMGDKDEKEKPIFAPMPSGAKIESVSLDKALRMFELPRLVGKTEEGQPIHANIGRFGPYVKVGSIFISIKPLDPLSISEAEAKRLYTEKLKQLAEKNIADFGGGLKVLNGRFGPYVTDGKGKNARIPKGTDPKKIDETAARELLDKAPARKSFKKPAK